MNILVLGGTRFMGKHLVSTLISRGHQVTLATRNLTPDDFHDQVTRLVIERSNKESLQAALCGAAYDVVIDNICYCANDVKILLDIVQCKHYIQVSTASVYDHFHMNIAEEEFDASTSSFIYCNRDELAYGQAKQSAECAIVQDYPHIPSTRIRFPFIIGTDDYTRRLYFYIDHIVNEKAMFIDNPDSQIGVVRSCEAGAFLAYLAEHPYLGALNVASLGTLTVRQLNQTVNKLTKKSMINDEAGDRAPYNGAPSFSLQTEKAQATGFHFSNLDEWLDELIEHDVALATKKY